jgi:hypothetical protein
MTDFWGLPVLPVWVDFLPLVLVIILAFRRGSYLDRVAVVGYLITNVIAGLTPLTMHALRFNHGAAILALGVLSVAEVLFFIAILLKSDNYWHLAACSVAMLELATYLGWHFLDLVDWAVGTGELIWYFVMLICLTGAILHSGKMRLADDEVSDGLLSAASKR